MSGKSEPTFHREYSAVPDSFVQDDEDTDPWSFDYTSDNFGLKSKYKDLEPSWQFFEKSVNRLNQRDDPDVQWKVLFMGRHGEGVHNVAEKYYGTPAWNCKYSLHDGDDTMNWADAHLTPAGIAQAQTAHDFWATQLKDQKMPAPQSYYSSPLDRCLATANVTFSGLDLPADRPYAPIVKELLRETNGLHTCDRRSSRTYIRTHYPNFRIEPSLTENDELWAPDLRESDSALDVRLLALLDDVFENDGNTWISFTSHSGAIAGLLRVLGHRPFVLLTGSVIPVLVMARLVEGARPQVEVEPGWAAPECEEV